MEQKPTYNNRIADEVLARKLLSSSAVLLQGPKWCGKTTTAEQLAKSILYMADPDSLQKNLFIASTNVKSLLVGDTPRLIDEWQVAPQIWDAVRFESDKRKNVGQFILTGSAVPPVTNKIQHTGTGRISRVTMRPMSLWESKESNGTISLQDLFEKGGEPIFGECEKKLEDIAFYICRGGWPMAATIMKGESALETAYSYYEAITEIDISRVDSVRRSQERTKKLMRSLARNQGTQTSYSKLKDDIATNDSRTLDEDTVASYIEALKKIFVVEDMEAWNPNLRSKCSIRTTDTRYFVDPSIAVAALGIGPNDLLNDLNTMGFLFETMAVRDLRVYADALYGRVFHYRDNNNLECDAVVHLRDGHYGLVEIKLGGEKLINEAIESLNKLARKINTDKMYPPSFKMVLTAVGNIAYLHEKGVYVVPICCLKP